MASGPPDATSLRRDMVFVVLVATVLRLTQLTGLSMWTDELLRMTWARGVDIGAVVEMPASELGRHAKVEGVRRTMEVVNRHNPPAQAVFLNRYLAYFKPNTDFTLRLPFALFGIFAVLGAALAARELAGRAAGIVVGLLSAISPFQVAYTQEVNHYALGLCFSAFSFWFFLRFLKRNQPLDGALWAACGVLGLYTHYYVGLVVAAQGLAMIPWLSGGSRRVAFLLSPLAVMALAFAPYLPRVLSQAAELTSDLVSGAFGGWPYFQARVVDALLFPWLGHAATRLPLALGAIAGLCSLVLIFLGVRSEPERNNRWLLATTVAVPSLVVFASYWLHRNNTHMWPRYGLFFTPAIYLTVGLLIVRARPGLRAAAAGACLVAMVTGLGFFYGTFKKEDWRGAAELINRTAVAGEAIVVTPYNLTPALAHYLTVEAPVSSLSVVEKLPPLVERLAAGEGVFIVRAWDGAWDGASAFSDLLDDALACHFEERQITRFFGLQVTHLRRQVNGAACARASVPAVEGGCWLEPGSDTATATGWVKAPPGPQQVEFVDAMSGKTVGAAELEPAAEQEPMQRPYRASLALAGLPVGEMHLLTTRLAPGNPPLSLGRQVLCLRRPQQAIRTGPLSEHADLDAPWPTVQGQLVQFAGWAYSSVGIREVVFKLDGAEVARTRAHGIRRIDVENRYPEVDPALSGFSGYFGQVSTRELTPGPHAVTAEVVHLDGTTRAVERSVVLSVLPSKEKRTAERGYLESAAVSENGTRLTVRGWAFSSLGIARLRISIDGKESRSRDAGTDERQDVSSHFTEFEPALTKHSGFSETLDTSNLAPGSHTVQVEMVHADQTTAPLDNPLTFTR